MEANVAELQKHLGFVHSYLIDGSFVAEMKVERALILDKDIHEYCAHVTVTNEP